MPFLDRLARGRWLRPIVASTPLLALLLAGCLLVPITDTSAPHTEIAPGPHPLLDTLSGPDTLSGIVEPNPALVGLYQSEVMTRTGFGPWTEVMTLTMSLFADGTYEQLYDSAADWGTGSEPRNKIVAGGSWYIDGDTGVLLDHRGAEERFMTLGSDALVTSLPTTWFGITVDAWVLSKKSATPEALYACLVKQILTTARSEADRAPNPALAGVYVARPQFVQETGTVAATLTLFADGWAEYGLALEGIPDAFPLQYGLWTANEAAKPLVNLSLVSRHSGFVATDTRAYQWNGTSLFYLGEQTGSAYALPLTHTGNPAQTQMAPLRDFVMSGAAVPAFMRCRWEAR